MEALIARLLNDFENGRMSRRQLVQSLAMAAVAAPFASAGAKTGGFATNSAPATTSASLPAVPYKTVWLDHISFGCTDYKRSADFYTDLMGWTPVPGSDNGRQVVLNVGDIGQIIVRNSARPAAPAGATAPAPSAAPGTAAGTTGRGGARPPVHAVIDHIAFGVEPWDTETVRAELEKRGLKPREDTGGPEPIATSKYKSFHVRDPDGWDLQISNASKAHHDLP